MSVINISRDGSRRSRSKTIRAKDFETISSLIRDMSRREADKNVEKCNRGEVDPDKKLRRTV